MGYANLLARRLIRSPLVWGCVLALAVVGALPLAIGPLIWGEAMYRMNLATNLEIAAQNESSHAFDSAPPQLRESIRRELEAMRAASSAQTRSEFWSHMSDYQQLLLESMAAGGLSADPVLVQADAALCAQMAALDNPPATDTGADLPFVAYLSYAVGSAPALLWFAPAIVVACLLQTFARPGRLLDGRTQRPRTRLLAMAAVGIIAPVVMVAVSLAPALIASVALNGVGDPAFPVVLVRGGMVVTTTAGRAAAQGLALIALGSALLSAASVVVGQLVGSPAAGSAVAAVLCVIPLWNGYFAASSPVAGAVAMLPTTYLVPDAIVGHAGSFFVDATPVAALDPVVGAGVLAAWTATFLAVGLATARLEGRRPKC